jgi:lipid-A-disaccharide synthase-like uncharacterized protein
MFYWIYDLPTPVVAAMFAAAFVGSTWLMVYLCRTFLHGWFHTEKRANDMIGFAFSTFSVLYGLLVGLLAVAAYQNFSGVGDVVTKEASSLGALYRDLGAYPQPIRGKLQNDLRDYTRFVVDRAWPQQRRGVIPTEGTQRITQFVDDLMAFEPVKKSEEIAHAEAYKQLNAYIELRRSRLASVNTGIPAVFWWVVALGAFISLLMLAMLDMEVHVQLVLTGIVSLFLGLAIFLVAAMDHPFRGEISIGPEAFEQIYQSLMKPDDAVARAMADLIGGSETYGLPTLRGEETIEGRAAPVLFFGEKRMNGFFDVVDAVAQKDGGVATLFVRSGDGFVRIATNVRRDDGSRAVGSILDPNGPAMRAIRQGKPYYGEADILGKPYMTGYEPIKDAQEHVLGLFFTGYPKAAPKPG